MDICVFDIETCSAKELHRRPDFMRLYGFTERDGSITTTADVDRLIERLAEADACSAFNGINFDALALAKWAGADYLALCHKMWDSFLVERHLQPVAAQGMQRTGFYTLDETAKRYDVPSKTDDIKALARKWGGFDLIPENDESYHAYLRGDVEAARAVMLAQQRIVSGMPERDRQYIRREHRVAAALAYGITLKGLRVDKDFALRQYAEGQQRLQDAREKLHADHGMPLEGKAPHRTNLGKAAFRRAVLATGISETALDANWPTAKDGSLLTGKDVLKPLVELFDRTNKPAADLCRTILAMNGERSVFGTVLDHMHDGLVHPGVSADQASGRWSLREPGLTVLGKRSGKHVERNMILADNDDEVLVAIDADQVDARVVAAECQDPEYMKLFEPGRDLHSEVAWLVWPNVSQHGPDCTHGDRIKCKCSRRSAAKVSGHGFSYGLGARGMAAQQGIPVEACQAFIDGFTRAFPRLAAWKEEKRREAGALGWGEAAPEGDTYRILRTWAGRPVRVERSRAYTQATALIGQGGTRDVMAHALLSLPFEWRHRMRAIVHDEFVFSLPRDGAAELGQRIADRMAFDLRGVRITFGVSKPGRSWGGCYE